MLNLNVFAATVVALVLAANVLVPVRNAAALPVAVAALKGAFPEGLAVEPAAHKAKRWYWHRGWWRHGPWSDHTILGMVVTGPVPSGIFVPWGIERLRWCAATYRSFDGASGTYIDRHGHRRVCHR